jgi:hypothetical protein
MAPPLAASFDGGMSTPALEPIIAKVSRHRQAAGMRARTVTLKVKFADFQQITRSKTVGDTIDSLADLEQLSPEMVERGSAAYWCVDCFGSVIPLPRDRRVQFCPKGIRR